ncbi:EscC/YscC/HrcC family type III secretion system outer membrane ring protein [Salmonella enterica subsp. enterica]|nr:EscC/YscC/HrcC family type III secretion system outer membrane ring protein [Salmonella enterica subsp. enterica serovar Bonn]EBZ5939298.1 EscC/YscC/HrcC family type III secretion system outer membrane ring protein [Salmonella enterica subsp. enterica serovar Muenchen]MLZ41042.1 EscC/YscC/HrcC family type III secretion system outer membrane ring protein [Salmonella enterica subsp. enterica serovar Bonn]
MSKFFSKICIGLVAISSFTCAFSAQPSWQGDEYFLQTKGIPVKILLRDLGANYQIPVIVSDLVTDSFVGKIKNEKPQETLGRLKRLFNLVTYYDGEVLHVYKAREVTSTVITSQFLTPESINTYLRKNKLLSSDSCQFKQVADLHAFELRGVPVCVERISRLIKEVDSKAKTRATSTENLEIFPLQFVSATDTKYHYRSQEVIVPGLVSVLNQMKSGAFLGSQTGEESPDTSSVQFSADPSQNAIIVRAREVDMPLYRQLIKKMDKKQHQIEISVSIIDVDAANIKQLGVDWRGTVGTGKFGASFNTDNGSGSSYVSGVISNSAQFMANVKALQLNSKARILSQPSVVTQNNVQAILDKNITFYTKLEGKNVATLESVTSGTLMRVTPRVVEDVNSPGVVRDIMLNLNIQDGQQSGVTSSSEPLPQIQNSEITTQATLTSGQSLLLGGFVQDKEVSYKKGIPLLGDLPVVGGLFSSTTNEVHSVVRLFLIKATPVNIDGTQNAITN